MYVIFVLEIIERLYWSVCVRILYEFDLLLRRVWIVLRCVFHDSGNMYTYRLHVLQIHYGVRVFHLQHRHVFRRFHMKCMLAIL